MKKLTAILTTIIMSFALLTGCGNPVYDDFENFLNSQMVEVNANYDKITAEAGTWENLSEDAELIASLNDTLIPLVEDSLEKLEGITTETEEVGELKAKYIKVMEAYKEGFNFVLEGVQAADEAIVLKGNDKISEGIDLLAEYNEALESLASEVGAEIEY